MHSDRIAVLAASRRSFRRSLLPGVDRERVAHSGAAIAVAVTTRYSFNQSVWVRAIRGANLSVTHLESSRPWDYRILP